ncbi:MAG: YlxR family protein [Coriobacteriales bacterium]|nr:YlxR family protein [Coriobacteriales bacterium]
MNTSKTPIRTCVACRQKAAKSTLLRIVRLADRSVGFDGSGNLPGRGAYLCRHTSCFTAAQNSRRLQRALRCDLDEATWIDLARDFNMMCQSGT